jgi:ubiquinone/menaquinone biosynthesis C-methylase UbiE
MSELATQASHWSNAAKMFATKAPTDIFSLDTLKLTKLEAHSKPVKVFDNGCGGGGLAAMIAEKFPNATVLATDFAPGMVEATKNRIQHLGLTNISAEVQDATSLTLESNQFDVSHYS